MYADNKKLKIGYLKTTYSFFLMVYHKNCKLSVRSQLLLMYITTVRSTVNGQ